MTNFNVITPFARVENYEKLKDHLRPKNINWHVITDLGHKATDGIGSPEEPWVQHYVCPNNTGPNYWDKCNNSMNWFLNTQKIDDDQWYCFINDDDGYEPNFFDKIATGIDKCKPNLPEIVIASMKRGDNSPDRPNGHKHETNTLYARPESMHMGGVGLEQIVVKGRILNLGYRFPLFICGDGMFIMSITHHNPTLYIPDAYVWFNYFEPGRWNA
jgi:hypothetical protein